MAVIRKNELRRMSIKELDEKEAEIVQELFKERGKISTGGIPDNPGKISELRKTIARIKTIKGEKGKST